MTPLRLFKASSFTTGALQTHYASHPDLNGAGYTAQWNSLRDSLLVGTDFWQAGLESGGRFEVFETVLNCRPLQAAWALENGIAPLAGHREILLAQIEAFRPEVFFSHDFEILDPAFRAEARRRAPSIRLVFGWDGIAKNDARFFAGCDLMLTCIPHVAEYYKSQNIPGELLPYSFHDSLADRIPQACAKFPVTFSGSIQVKSHLHFQRAETLYHASRQLPLRLHASGSVQNWQWTHREQRRRLRHFQIHQARIIHSLGRKNFGPLFGMEMFRFLAESGITLNIHSDAARGQASNMRLFEATGAGSCLLTDWQADLGDYFVPDVEVATYRDTGELIAKANFLLGNEGERMRIARAGQARTRRDHLFSRRALLIEEILRRHL